MRVTVGYYKTAQWEGHISVDFTHRMVTNVVLDYKSNMYAEDNHQRMQFGSISDLPVIVHKGTAGFDIENERNIVFARDTKNVYIFEPRQYAEVTMGESANYTCICVPITEYLQDKRNNSDKYFEIIESVEEYMQSIDAEGLSTYVQKASLLGISEQDAVQQYTQENTVYNCCITKGNKVKYLSYIDYILYKATADVTKSLSVYIPAEMVTPLFRISETPVADYVACLMQTSPLCTFWISNKWQMHDVLGFMGNCSCYGPGEREFAIFLYKKYLGGTLKCVGTETPSFKLLIDILRNIAEGHNLIYCLYVSGMIPDSIVDGPGLRYAVFTQGCPHHCEGCHNPQTWSLKATEGTRIVHYTEIVNEIKKNPLITGVTFSGGEPFLQSTAIAVLANKIKEECPMVEDIVVYTGYTVKYCPTCVNDDLAFFTIPSDIDYVIDGKFEKSKKNLDLLFRGSSNQRIIDISRSRIAKEIVSIEDFE